MPARFIGGISFIFSLTVLIFTLGGWTVSGRKVGREKLAGPRRRDTFEFDVPVTLDPLFIGNLIQRIELISSQTTTLWESSNPVSLRVMEFIFRVRTENAIACSLKRNNGTHPLGNVAMTWELPGTRRIDGNFGYVSGWTFIPRGADPQRYSFECHHDLSENVVVENGFIEPVSDLRIHHSAVDGKNYEFYTARRDWIANDIVDPDAMYDPPVDVNSSRILEIPLLSSTHSLILSSYCSKGHSYNIHYHDKEGRVVDEDSCDITKFGKHFCIRVHGSLPTNVNYLSITPKDSESVRVLALDIDMDIKHVTDTTTSSGSGSGSGSSSGSSTSSSSSSGSGSGSGSDFGSGTYYYGSTDDGDDEDEEKGKNNKNEGLSKSGIVVILFVMLFCCIAGIVLVGLGIMIYMLTKKNGWSLSPIESESGKKREYEDDEKDDRRSDEDEEKRNFEELLERNNSEEEDGDEKMLFSLMSES